MKKIGIIAAMEEEVKDLVAALQDLNQQQVAHMTFFEGDIAGQDVVLVQSGIGKVNAAMAATVLIERFSVEAIINTGSAGAVSDRLDIGDLVISNQLAYHDADARAFGYKMGQVPQMPLYYHADDDLNEQMKRAAKKVGFNPYIGEILSSDSFVSDTENIDNIKSFFPKADVTEMEGAAIAQVCYQYQIPFTVVRAVSDSANEDASVDFDRFIVEAGKKSADMVIECLASMAED